MTIATHNGSFHADDLFACAVLKLIYPDAEIIRTRDMEKINSADIVLDVGGIYDETKNRYDHHQKGGAGVRENKIPYAAFGLIWKHFGMQLCANDESVWKKIERKIVMPLDAIDNGIDIDKPIFPDVMPYFGDMLFNIFQPTWKEKDKNIDIIFAEQVEKVIPIIAREIQVGKDDTEAEALIKQGYEHASDKQIVVLEDNFPRYLYQSILSSFPEPIYVVFPGAKQDHWKIEAIRKTPDTMQSRKLLPEAWRGSLDGDTAFATVTGIPDAQFCHTSGFLATAGSKESILKLAAMAIKAQ